MSKLMRSVVVLALLAVGVSLATTARPVHAATDVVTTCDEATLRSVIASALPGDTVTFGCSGTIGLTSGGGGVITLAKNLTIDGSGRSVTVSGGGSVQVFSVSSGATVTLNGLTITGGHVSAYGGGVMNRGHLTVSNSTVTGNSTGAYGGGISNFGTLTVSNTSLTANSSSGYSGGLYNQGTATLTGTTLSGNTAVLAGGAIMSLGLFSNTVLTATNSTFSGNVASRGSAIEVLALIEATSTAALINSTVSANSGTAIDAGGFGSSAQLTNTILAGSGSANCSGGSSIQDSGGNLADDASCNFSQPSSQSNATGLKLGALTDNGGPTQTVALGAGSTAIDFSTCLQAVDQRGMPRPDITATRCDSGAFEFQDSDLGLTGMPANQTVTATSVKGAAVTYTAPSASDEAGDNPAATVACLPASGSTFAIGTTSVTCRATDPDDTNSPVSASFTVTVNATLPAASGPQRPFPALPVGLLLAGLGTLAITGWAARRLRAG